MGTLPIGLIAIDGPGGVGKSSVARALAERLGYYFLSSGLIYRAMAWRLMEQGWQPGEPPDPAQLAEFSIRVDGEGAIWINEVQAPLHLHGEAISQAASRVSQHPPIRDLANRVQRETVARIGREKTYPGVILEGRDIGTVVFPEAPHKIFLTAGGEERARRRYLEQQEQHPTQTLEEVHQALRERDQRDEQREVAPLVPAPDAVIIDTSTLSLPQVVEDILNRVESASR